MLTNKYSATYFRIIERARLRGKINDGERHHIIPVSLGGSNRKDNLVDLTLKEHFVCHLLLTKMTEGDARLKMVAAFSLMAGRYRGHIKRMTARLYTFAREGLSERTKAQWANPKHRESVTKKLRERAKERVEAGWVPPWTGKPRSEENRRAIGDRQRGKKRPEEMKAKQRRPCDVNGVVYATFGEAKLAHPQLKTVDVTWLKPEGRNERKRRAGISEKLGTACIFDGVIYSSIRQANKVANLGQGIKNDPRFSLLD